MTLLLYTSIAASTLALSYVFSARAVSFRQRVKSMTSAGLNRTYTALLALGAFVIASLGAVVIFRKRTKRKALFPIFENACEFEAFIADNLKLIDSTAQKQIVKNYEALVLSFIRSGNIDMARKLQDPTKQTQLPAQVIERMKAARSPLVSPNAQFMAKTEAERNAFQEASLWSLSDQLAATPNGYLLASPDTIAWTDLCAKTGRFIVNTLNGDPRRLMARINTTLPIMQATYAYSQWPSRPLPIPPQYHNRWIAALQRHVAVITIRNIAQAHAYLLSRSKYPWLQSVMTEAWIQQKIIKWLEISRPGVGSIFSPWDSTAGKPGPPRGLTTEEAHRFLPDPANLTERRGIMANRSQSFGLRSFAQNLLAADGGSFLQLGVVRNMAIAQEIELVMTHSCTTLNYPVYQRMRKRGIFLGDRSGLLYCLLYWVARPKNVGSWTPGTRQLRFAYAWETLRIMLGSRSDAPIVTERQAKFALRCFSAAANMRCYVKVAPGQPLHQGQLWMTLGKNNVRGPYYTPGKALACLAAQLVNCIPPNFAPQTDPEMGTPTIDFFRGFFRSNPFGSFSEWQAHYKLYKSFPPSTTGLAANTNPPPSVPPGIGVFDPEAEVSGSDSPTTDQIAPAPALPIPLDVQLPPSFTVPPVQPGNPGYLQGPAGQSQNCSDGGDQALNAIDRGSSPFLTFWPRRQQSAGAGSSTDPLPAPPPGRTNQLSGADPGYNPQMTGDPTGAPGTEVQQRQAESSTWNTPAGSGAANPALPAPFDMQAPGPSGIGEDMQNIEEMSSSGSASELEWAAEDQDLLWDEFEEVPEWEDITHQLMDGPAVYTTLAAFQGDWETVNMGIALQGFFDMGYESPA